MSNLKRVQTCRKLSFFTLCHSCFFFRFPNTLMLKKKVQPVICTRKHKLTWEIMDKAVEHLSVWKHIQLLQMLRIPVHTRAGRRSPGSLVQCRWLWDFLECRPRCDFFRVPLSVCFVWVYQAGSSAWQKLTLCGCSHCFFFFFLQFTWRVRLKIRCPARLHTAV